MIDNKALIKVTNRSRGGLTYTIPDLGIRREYAPNETKEVTAQELRKLSYISGGKVMIDRYLVIQNAALVRELLGYVEPEYYYTEKDIVELLLRGTLDQLDDCLTFGGQGVIEVVKRKAVELEINDVSKRELIFKKTGYNVNNAITINRESKAVDEEESAKTQRKAAPINAPVSEGPVRKAEPPKYKVISTGK